MDRLELKFCERCGSLWLRPADKSWCYCALCKRLIDELPPVRTFLQTAKEVN